MKNSLSGFGRERKENKGSSKKLLRLSEKELKVKAINYHIKGNLDEAEKGYIAFIKNGFSDADIFSNYALICEGKGDLDKAIKLYKKCTFNFPNHVFSKINLSFLYYKINDLKVAENLVNDAIKLKPNLANGYSIKGLILKKLNRFDESKLLFMKAIELDSNYVDAYINLGLLNKDLNNLNDAEKYYLKAIEIDNESAIAHLNLGVCFKEKFELEKALMHTEIAIKLNSKLENSYLNLAAIYNQKGEYTRSITLAKKELSINENSELSYQLISELIKKVEPLYMSARENRELLSKILKRTDISHRELFGNIKNIISNKILEKLSISEIDLNENKEFNMIIQDKELIEALKLLIFSSPVWEKVLRTIRKIMLINYSEDRKISKNTLNFTIALGSQCFLNEYIYYISKEEKYKLEIVKESIHKNQNQEYKLALISCYESLFSINNKNIDLNKYKSNNPEFNKLLDSQFREIIHEKQISKKIKRIGNISDSISQEVKEQYELNPYPRWRYNSYAKENKINFISIVNSEIYPNTIKSSQIKSTSNSISILIAGCGTGIQILEASRYNNCEITAIDLSNSSISYAKRKVDEYGMKNISFIEMDLLELSQLNKQFDLIECSGVLHHMKNPAKGLSNLIDSLKPKGFLKLGLYSRYAREKILKARALISKNNIKPNLDEIRNFRNDVLNGNIKNLNQLTSWSDFYSTSMCRDLCFHSHEKCYSIPEVKKMIETANLEFLGFTLSKEIKDKFQREHKDIESLKDLQLWNKFEISNRDSFREMYQFWTRKSIK